ncbi:MAG: threonine synthase [Sphaerobacter sp.]|nr:threonine synthase [Sphaerobacter sp.]
MHLRCGACGATHPADRLVIRCHCGGLLDVVIDRNGPIDRAIFDRRLTALVGAERSGVWRYRELLPPLPDTAIVTKPEGNTNLYEVPGLAAWAGVSRLVLKHEGENPTGSFKDRGMTVATSHALWVGASVVACASTGNTSASVAAYAAAAGLPAIVFLPVGKISAAKLGQAIAYGARIVQIRGDFDAAMALVQEAARRFGIYLLNSINPFRLEGQKTIVVELLHQLGWEVPDWIILPGGNLGNTAAVGKALAELHEVGLIGRMPRVAVVQAEGAAPFYAAYRTGFKEYRPVHPETVATAIRIGDPVSYAKARRTIEVTGGVVAAVSDAAILEAKARIDRAGIGCEPASAATLAGLRALVAEGVIPVGASVAGILTGHLMKDTDAVMAYHLGPDAETHPLANPPRVIDPTPAALEELLSEVL